MKAAEFDNLFDQGKDISEYLDLSQSKRPNHQQKKVSVNIPVWLLDILNKEAKRIGVTLHNLIKFKLAEYSGRSSSKTRIQKPDAF